MTPRERIERMLETEEQIRARCGREVTCDPPLVRAEIRAGCLREVLRVLDSQPKTDGPVLHIQV